MDFQELLRLEPDIGTTNIRNAASFHWKPWLGAKDRCLVPFTSFSEYDTDDLGKKGPVWFAFGEERPLAFFAGLWCSSTCVRKKTEGEVTADLYAFLTCEPTDPVATIHPKAMPVVLNASP